MPVGIGSESPVLYCNGGESVPEALRLMPALVGKKADGKRSVQR